MLRDGELTTPGPRLGPTLDLSPGAGPPPGDAAREPTPRLCGHRGMVEGSAANLQGQTRLLLLGRLRASAAVIFFGMGVMLLWAFVYSEAPLAQDGLQLAVHSSAVLIEGGVVLLLLRFPCLTLRALRVVELVVFGVPAARFLAMGPLVAEALVKRVSLPGPLIPWVLLIFIYGMFIPNTWRRAALVIGAMGAAPLVLWGVLRWRHPELAPFLGLPQWIEMGIAMGVTVLAAVLGTHLINSLRCQVFAAQQLGQYRLKRKLGAGGMGEVYLAEHQLLKRPCAVKVIRPSAAADPQALARFEREVRATAMLTHPNTVEIYDYGRTEDGTFYYVMEYLPGCSSAELVERHGPLCPPRAVYLLRQVCGALAEAHAWPLVHRDLKPANIFVAERGGMYDVAKLLDFGLVSQRPDEDTQLTQEGSVTGSPLYMSPEQALGSTPDARSDIYSLGAVAYFWLTGQPPFTGERPMEVLVAHARDPVRPPRELRSEIPPDLEAIVLRCLEKRPEDRFASVMELDAALKQCSVADQWNAAETSRWWAEHSGISPRAASAVVR